MEYMKGKLVRWIDKKGFGFIKPENGKGDIFIHISEFKGMSRKPVVGDVIHYKISLDDNGKPRAVNVSIEGVEQVPGLQPLKQKRKNDRTIPLKNISSRKSTKANKPPKSYKLLALLIAIGIGVVLNAFQERNVNFIPSYQQQSTESGGNQRLTNAYKNQQSDIQVDGSGVVVAILPDDIRGSRHQRFLLRLSSGQTLLIAHNIDLAPRIDLLREGDVVEFYGEYEWNSKGGVMHWTHHDPQGKHESGWLKHKGSIYQ